MNLKPLSELRIFDELLKSETQPKILKFWEKLDNTLFFQCKI
jgi:hypothetical protein